MKINSLKSYGSRADKAMTTWIQLFRSFNKIRAKESLYIQSCDLTMNQFQVLEVLYHRGDLSIGAITKIHCHTKLLLLIVKVYETILTTLCLLINRYYDDLESFLFYLHHNYIWCYLKF